MIPASIPSPSVNELVLGPLHFRYYGLFIAVGLIVSYYVVRRRYDRFTGDPEFVDRVFIWVVVAGFIGARIGYVITHSGNFSDEPWKVIAVWEGGLAFFGGIVGGAIAALVLVRKRGGDLPALLDSVAIGIPLAQVFGRLGNYFNQELFGTPSTLPWALEIEPQNRPGEYVAFETFHPTFAYEMLWNLATIGLLLVLERRVRMPRGNLFLLYLVSYGVGRFLMELLRTDTTFRLLGLSRNGWISLGVAVGATVYFVIRQRRQPQEASGSAPEPDTESDAGSGTDAVGSDVTGATP